MNTETENPKVINQPPQDKGQNSKIINYQLPITYHPHAILILSAFIILAIIYSIATPPFEAGDESRHYAVVKYIADTGRLPIQHGPETRDIQHHWSHEGNQPPLYYALAAALIAWIDRGDWNEVFWYNPHTSIGNPLRPDNKNITIHPPGEGWPWRGRVLAVHLIRFLSIAMATVTVMTSYAIALILFKGRRWLAAGAMALTAFNPMFIFISASVNNDNAVIMFVTLALWVMVRLGDGEFGRWGDGEMGRLSDIVGQQTSNTDTPAPLLPCSPASLPLYLPVLLGLLIGLGALSKLYAFGLLPLAALLFFWLAYQAEKQKRNGAKSQLSMNNAQDNRELLSTVKSQTRPDSVPHYQFPISNLQSPISTLQSPSLWRNILLWSAVLGVVFMAVAGWFYVRNALLYQGDLFALDVMRDAAGQRTEIPSLATIRAEFEGFRIAYWALFGGVNILADNWIYKVLDSISLIAVVGVVAFILRLIINLRRTTHYALRLTSPVPRPPFPISLPTFTLLLLWYLIMLTGFIVWNLTQPAGQGRLMYPAIAAISALGMLGLTWWLPMRGQKIVATLCSLGLFTFASLSPFLYIAPAYAKPPILTQADLPADMQAIDLTYDGKMRLLGYKLQINTIRPAQALPLTLYWELLEPTDLNYSVFIHLLGRQRQVVGQLDTYPGGGQWPTTLLEPGDILADAYEIPISAQAEFEHAPTRLHIAAGIYDLNEPGRPGKPATNASGQPVEPLIASTKLIPWQWPTPPKMETPINFFDKVTLLSHHIAGDQQSITFNWQVNHPLESDYTVFIQAWRADTSEYMAGFDGPPVQNDYPTSMWAPGEIIVDTHALDLSLLPPGDYYLLAGLYDPTNGERLPAFGPEGPLPDYAVEVGGVQVEESKE